MTTTVSDSLIDAINDDAFAELETEVVIEKIEVPIANNEETIKKIEDSRKFLTAESTAGASYGLKQESKASPSTPKPASTYESTRATYNSTSGYGYNSSYSNSSYRYGQEKETIETKAGKAVDEAYKKILERVEKSKSVKSSNWNTLYMMDEDKIEEMKSVKSKKKRIVTEEQAKKRIEKLNTRTTIFLSLLETLYIVYNKT